MELNERELNERWVGVPANLLPQAKKIFFKHKMTKEEKVVELHLISALFFSTEIISQILDLSWGKVYRIVRESYLNTRCRPKFTKK